MTILTLPSHRSEIKSDLHKQSLTPRQQRLVDQAWRFCRPQLIRLQTKAPHKATVVSAVLGRHLIATIKTWNPEWTTLREWTRHQFRHALIASVLSGDNQTQSERRLSA